MTPLTYLSLDQRVRRLARRLTELAHWERRAVVPLDAWSFNDAPLARGARWPERRGVVSLEHPTIEVPADWRLQDTRLQLDLGGEALVEIISGGRARTYGLDPYHTSFPLYGREVSVSAQAVARSPFGVPNRDARLARAELVLVEPELIGLTMALAQVIELAQTLGGYAVDGPGQPPWLAYRAHPDHSAPHEVVEAVLDVAEQAFRALDWPTATHAYVSRVAPGREAQSIWELPADLSSAPAALDDRQRGSVAQASRTMRDGLAALQRRYPQVGSIALTGHAHIDLAWLWPLDETRRKARRTFHTAVDLMERYPEFRFNQSTAQLYDFVEKEDPALFAAVREKVAAGQWEVIGGSWVEPDTNMPTAESFCRQFLYGTAYFDRAFGQRSRVHWLPDCFGFSPALPQILRLSGLDSFFTIKVTWSEADPFPYDLFWWEGLDGSRVLSHTFSNPVGGYNGDLGVRAATETWRNFRGKHRHPESLLSIGWGDGGGGVTEEMLERAKWLADFPVVPALRQVSVGEWFGELHAKAEQGLILPVWVGEIYLEFHRGTLTTQGRTKFLHRRAERSLIAAEVLSSMSRMLGGAGGPDLGEQWRLLLRNQFHDILPGSSIREVYELAESELSSVVEAAGTVIERQLSSIAEQVVQPGSQPGLLVVNPDLSERPLRLNLTAPVPGSQQVENGHVLSDPRKLPALSASVLLGAGAASGLSVSAGHIENDQVRVQIAADGTLSSVLDKRAGRECLSDRGNQIWTYVDKPRDFDAWDIEEDYPSLGQEIVASGPAEVVEHGPHRAAVRIVRRFRDSTIVQHVRIWANSPRIEFRTEIDWHDRRQLVKARFPLAIRSDHATFECAAGVVRRTTQRNTTWDLAKFEVAAHRFADLSEHGYGVALLNDGKYGHHAVGNELGLSLLRSPVYPDPLADEGRQAFTYALLPHSGDWMTGGVLAEAEDLNAPLMARPVSAAAEASFRPVDIGGLPLALSGFKTAEDGKGLVLRTYEPAGARGQAIVTPAAGWALTAEVNVLEEPSGPPDLAFTPFRIHSWRLERTDA
jgi:alpha-mannosidase